MFEQQELEVARTAAIAASRILKKYFRSANLIDFKSTYNLVSQADRESEAKIVEVIRKNFPEHEILGWERAIWKSLSGLAVDAREQFRNVVLFRQSKQWYRGCMAGD